MRGTDTRIPDPDRVIINDRESFIGRGPRFRQVSQAVNDAGATIALTLGVRP